MTNYLILVDEKDRQWGKLEKMLVHELGLLHRAFSVFIFNSKGELLLQQRADHKYHSAGLWTNTCCSHPSYGEDLQDAVERRMEEEMGMQCKTNFAFSFTYRAEFVNGLVEHEFDHVFFGVSDKLPTPNAEEVKSWKYMDLETLERSVQENPELYTEWMKICLPEVRKHFLKFQPLTSAS